MSGPKRASRSALKGMVPDEIEEITGPDFRSERVREIGDVGDPQVLSTIREIFEGTELLANAEKVGLILSIRNEVRAEWQNARASFLSIGRALLTAEERLTVEEFRRLRMGSERLFPFSETVASQLRQVARAVDSGRLPEPECPGSYSVAYQLTLLDPPTLDLARDRNLLRPDVTRMEVINFRRELRDAQLPDRNRVDLGQLRREKYNLERRQQYMQKELTRIQSRLEEIYPLLSSE